MQQWDHPRSRSRTVKRTRRGRGAGYSETLGAIPGRLGAGVAAHLVVTGDAPPAPIAGVPVLADPTMALHGRLGAVDDTVYLIRPDSCLGYRGEPPDPPPLER